MGILAENDNQLWIALTDVWGGCLYSLKKGTHFVAKPAFCRAGDLNGLIIDKSRGRLYASSREPGLGTAGMIISLSLKYLKAAVKKSQVIEYEPEIHNLLKTDMPYGSKVQSIKLLNPEGQSTGLASIARDGDRIYLTDLWKGSLFAKSVQEITGSDSQMTYHNRIYTFSIDELLEFR